MTIQQFNNVVLKLVEEEFKFLRNNDLISWRTIGQQHQTNQIVDDVDDIVKIALRSILQEQRSHIQDGGAVHQLFDAGDAYGIEHSKGITIVGEEAINERNVHHWSNCSGCGLDDSGVGDFRRSNAIPQYRSLANKSCRRLKVGQSYQARSKIGDLADRHDVTLSHRA